MDVIINNIGPILLMIVYPNPIPAYCEAKRPDLRSKTVAFRF